MLILMDTIAIAGGVHTSSLFERAVVNTPKRDLYVRPSAARRALSRALYILAGGLERLSYRVCDECRARISAPTGRASAA